MTQIPETGPIVKNLDKEKKRDRQSGSIVAIVTVTITDLVYIFIKNGNKRANGIVVQFFFKYCYVKLQTKY